MRVRDPDGDGPERWTGCRAVHAWRASCAAGRQRTTARPTAQGHRRRGRLTVNLDRVFPTSPFPTETKELLGSRNCLLLCQAAEYVITRPARRASFGHPWRATATPFRDRHAFQVITSLPGMSPILGAELAAATGGDMTVFGTPDRLAGFGGRAVGPPSAVHPSGAQKGCHRCSSLCHLGRRSAKGTGSCVG
ncbi:transposase [Streptomyces mirabilis]|uniref:transposase n=1 Tax=Streptomyces mirabilis TaxID=68239 RepID=UPI0036918BDC